MKIQILTMMAERPDVSRVWAMGITRFIKAAPAGIECAVHVAFSNHNTKKLCDEYGFSYSAHPNHPLGKKLNDGLKACLSKEWDYLLIMGDDDFISNAAWPHYMQCIEAGYPYFGFGDIYFYSPQAGRVRHYDYATTGAPHKLMGCGRMVHRTVVEQSGWQAELKFRKHYKHGGVEYPEGVALSLPAYIASYLHQLGVAELTNGQPYFEFWNPSLQRGLDNDSEIRLLFNGHHPYRIRTDKPMMLDMKAENNLWSFAHFIGISKEAPADSAVEILSADELAAIAELWPTTGKTDLEEYTFQIGIRTAQQIFNDEVEKIARDKFAVQANPVFFQISDCTILNFSDHPTYLEIYWKHKTAHSKKLCGIYHEEINGTLKIYVKD